MAIEIGASAGASAATQVSLNIGLAGNYRLVVVVCGLEGDSALTNVTVDGKSCTKLYAIINTQEATHNSQEYWYILESALGSSNGVVTVAMVGGTTAFAIACQVFTGVKQGIPNDSNYNNTELVGPTIPVTGIDVSAGGLVVAGYGEGTQNLTATYTSPLVQRQSVDPSSADLFLASALESTAQSAKTYTATCSSTYNRATGIVASWDAAVLVTYELEGITKDKNGDILGSCECFLFKDNLDDTLTFVDYVVSNASTGAFSFTGISDNDAQYIVVAFKDNTPHVMDDTDHNLLPKEVPDTSYDLYLRSDVDKGETSPDSDLRLRSDADKLAVRVPRHGVVNFQGPGIL